MTRRREEAAERAAAAAQATALETGREIEWRREAEAALQGEYERLEARVSERTADLASANEALSTSRASWCRPWKRATWAPGSWMRRPASYAGTTSTCASGPHPRGTWLGQRRDGNVLPPPGRTLTPYATFSRQSGRERHRSVQNTASCCPTVRFVGMHVEARYSATSRAGRCATAAVTMDITERKRSDEARLRSQKLEALGTLAGGHRPRLQQHPAGDHRQRAIGSHRGTSRPSGGGKSGGDSQSRGAPRPTWYAASWRSAAPTASHAS